MPLGAAESPEEKVAVPVSPGEMLVSAREAAGMSRARIAADLGLTETAVRDIEENHFAKFAAGIYVRGYLKNYARLLGLEEQQLMQSFDHYCTAAGLSLDADGNCVQVNKAVRSKRPLVVGSIVAALLVIGLLAWMLGL